MRCANADQLQASEAPLAHDYKELHIPATRSRRLGARTARAARLAARRLHADRPAESRSIFHGDIVLARQWQPGLRFTADHRNRRAHSSPHSFRTPWRSSPISNPSSRRHPQGQLATLYCWPWHVQRVLLIGDAAHAIVPFHGQGLNCGFEDCVQLADLLARHQDAEPMPAAEFERSRRPNTDAIATMAIENYEEMRATRTGTGFRSTQAACRWNLSGAFRGASSRAIQWSCFTPRFRTPKRCVAARCRNTYSMHYLPRMPARQTALATRLMDEARSVNGPRGMRRTCSLLRRRYAGYSSIERKESHRPGVTFVGGVLDSRDLTPVLWRKIGNVTSPGGDACTRVSSSRSVFGSTCRIDLRAADDTQFGSSSAFLQRLREACNAFHARRQ